MLMTVKFVGKYCVVQTDLIPEDLFRLESTVLGTLKPILLFSVSPFTFNKNLLSF